MLSTNHLFLSVLVFVCLCPFAFVYVCVFVSSHIHASICLCIYPSIYSQRSPMLPRSIRLSVCFTIWMHYTLKERGAIASRRVLASDWSVHWYPASPLQKSERLRAIDVIRAGSPSQGQEHFSRHVNLSSKFLRIQGNWSVCLWCGSRSLSSLSWARLVYSVVLRHGSSQIYIEPLQFIYVVRWPMLL